MDYKTFRTGLIFAEVRRMLWVSSPDPSKWRYKRRSTVLGLWHQLKLEMWQELQRREDDAAVVREVASCEQSLPF